MRKGYAVAEVKNGACGGCQLQLPPQLVAEVRRGDELMDCSYCHRILFMAHHLGSGNLRLAFIGFHVFLACIPLLLSLTMIGGGGSGPGDRSR